MYNKNLLDALHIEDLDPELQEQLLNELGDVIAQGTMLRLIEAMDDSTRESFEKLIDSDVPMEAVDEFIKKHVPDSDKLLLDTINELQDDILTETSK